MKKVRVLDYSITVPGLPDLAGAYGAKGIELIVNDETEIAGLIENIVEIDHPDTFDEIHIDDIEYEVIDEDYHTPPYEGGAGNRVDRYYWLGYLGNYEVKGFTYDEDRKVLTLYTDTDRAIVELSYADSPIQLDTFTDEEINEHLLETYEEYTHEEGEE